MRLPSTRKTFGIYMRDIYEYEGDRVWLSIPQIYEFWFPNKDSEDEEESS